MVVGGTDLYFNLTLPKEFLTYNIRVVAVNTQGSRSGESNLYDVEVAAIELCGRMSGFSEVAGLNLEGKFVSIHAYIHHSRMTSMQTTNTFVVHIAYNYNKQWPWDGYYMYPACTYVNCV